MNVKLYNAAMIELEQLHWHLHLNEGPDLWTAHLLRMFKEALKDEEPAIEGPASIGKEPPQSAAWSQQPRRALRPARLILENEP